MTLVVKKISNGQFQVALIARNGLVLAAGAPRPRHHSAAELIASIRRSARPRHR